MGYNDTQLCCGRIYFQKFILISMARIGNEADVYFFRLKIYINKVSHLVVGPSNELAVNLRSFR